jgi:hypothetical protein
MDRHGTIREGVIAGALGATGVAVWFLLVDTIAGQPFFTPRVLGEAVKSVVAPDSVTSALVIVALYTVFHYAMFFLAGIVAIGMVRIGAYAAACRNDDSLRGVRSRVLRVRADAAGGNAAGGHRLVPGWRGQSCGGGVDGAVPLDDAS